MTYTVIMNDGTYRNINARNDNQAIAIYNTMYTEEEIKEKDMELVDHFGNTIA